VGLTSAVVSGLVRQLEAAYTEANKGRTVLRQRADRRGREAGRLLHPPLGKQVESHNQPGAPTNPSANRD
jgi:hypothetical protein